MVERNALQPAISREQLSGVEAQEQRISLLQQVREGLQADRRVCFAGEILYSPYKYGWLEAVDIIVAPVEPIYDPKKLNRFMHSLVPNIPRSAFDEALQRNERSDFSLGKLFFDEALGETKREIVITTTTVEPEALERAGVHIGESHKTEKETLQRRIWVRVYPDANSAQIITEYERGLKDGTVEPNSTFNYMQHWFSAEQLEEMKKAGPFWKFVYHRLASGL